MTIVQYTVVLKRIIYIWYSPFDQPKTGPKNQSKINSSTHRSSPFTHPLIYHPPTLTNNFRTLTPPSKKPSTRPPCQISAPNVDMCRGSQHARCHQPPVQTTTTTHVIPSTSHCHATTQLEYVTRTQTCMRCSSHPKFNFLHFIGNYFRNLKVKMQAFEF